MITEDLGTNCFGFIFKDAIKRDTRTALTTFGQLGRVQVCLAVITALAGIALIAVTASNAGLPVFNVGPLLTGLVELAAGVVAILAARREVRKDDSNSGIKFLMKVHFGLNTLAIVIASVSLIISGMATALCAGWESQFYYRDSGYRYTADYERYCDPNKDVKIAMSAISAVLCGVVFVCNCYAICVYCAYGSLFGLAYRKF